MMPALVVTGLWGLFTGTHVGLATHRIRGGLVRRLGEWRFLLLFEAVAAATFGGLVFYYATHRTAGAAGLGLGAVAGLGTTLGVVAGVGLALAVAGLSTYPRSPMALLGGGVRPPRGLEKITRHPFFAGLALFAGAHALLAPHVVGTVFFAGLLLHATLGAWHQDRKLLARHGAPYADYLAGTSILPLGAVMGGRQHLAWADLPLGPLAAGALVATALRVVHDDVFAGGGAWVIGTTVGGAAFFTLRAWRRSRHQERSLPAPQADAPSAIAR